MDSIDIFLYISYILTILAAIASIAFPLVNAAGNPKSMIKSGAGVGALLVIFLVSWLLSCWVSWYIAYTIRRYTAVVAVCMCLM